MQQNSKKKANPAELRKKRANYYPIFGDEKYLSRHVCKPKTRLSLLELAFGVWFSLGYNNGFTQTFYQPVGQQ